MLAKNQPWGLGGSLSLPLRTSAMAARREPRPTVVGIRRVSNVANNAKKECCVILSFSYYVTH
jgi:hypothetical protein